MMRSADRIAENLAAVRDPHLRVRQRTADAAGPVGARGVERDHRGALGQPVAFVHRESERARLRDQRRGNARAAHRHEPQAARRRLAQRDQRKEHLRQEDHAARPIARDGGEAGARIESGGAFHADLRERRRDPFGARGERRVDAGDVLEQQRERKQAQMPLDAQAEGGLRERMRHGALPGGAQARALRRAGRARGEAHLRGAQGQRHWRGFAAKKGQRQPGRTEAQAPRARLRGAVERVHAGGRGGVRELRGAEEERQRDERDARGLRREIAELSFKYRTLGLGYANLGALLMIQGLPYDSEQARTISVREAARLQSFPDGFIFTGTMNPAFRQIGNAVPPLMARSLAVEMLIQIKGEVANVRSDRQAVVDV